MRLPTRHVEELGKAAHVRALQGPPPRVLLLQGPLVLLTPEVRLQRTRLSIHLPALGLHIIWGDGIRPRLPKKPCEIMNRDRCARERRKHQTETNKKLEKHGKLAQYVR